LSKYNTALQLLLVGLTTLNPLLPYDLSGPLFYLQWVVAATTVGSGATYLFGGGVKYVK
jgi:cardiolipin synthase